MGVWPGRPPGPVPLAAGVLAVCQLYGSHQRGCCPLPPDALNDFIAASTVIAMYMT